MHEIYLHLFLILPTHSYIDQTTYNGRTSEESIRRFYPDIDKSFADELYTQGSFCGFQDNDAHDNTGQSWVDLFRFWKITLKFHGLIFFGFSRW